MAGSVNKVILIGNLGKDPEVRVLENGAKLARFPIATSESYQDKQSGERRDITEWHNIVVWRGLADIADNYLKKGSKVYIEGKIKSSTWQDETGNTRYNTEIVADNFTMLSSKQETQLNESNSPYPDQEPSKPSTPMSKDLTTESEDDDLPF
jgi:single-strand DNA-binding protein